MGLSLDFWLDFLGVAIVFALVIAFIPKFRAHSVRKAKAVKLRVRISETIKLSLPALAATSMQTLDAMGQPQYDSRALRFYERQLQSQLDQADVLYTDERERVARFLAMYEALIVVYEAKQLGSSTTEDTVLLGERILVDLKENGLLSTVKY